MTSASKDLKAGEVVSFSSGVKVRLTANFSSKTDVSAGVVVVEVFTVGELVLVIDDVGRDDGCPDDVVVSVVVVVVGVE